MKYIVLAAAFMLAAVGLGAFGAHALRPHLEATEHVDTWETAVLYHMVHGLGMLVLGVWITNASSVVICKTLRISAGFWAGGIVLFSGSLYALSLGGPGWLGPVTPLGGLCLMTGWLVLAIGAARQAPAAPGSA